MKNQNSLKEAFSFSVINYIGIIIGVFSTLIIYPKNKEIIGIFRYVEGLAHILYPVFVLGTSQALVNYYPKLNFYFRRRLFIYSIISIAVLSGIALLVVTIIYFIPFFNATMYLYYAFPIAVFLAYIELLKKKASIVQKITVPTFYDNIIPKIALPILFLIVYKKMVPMHYSLLLYIASYGMIVGLIAIYLRNYLVSISNFNYKELFVAVDRKNYYKFCLFAFTGSLGSVFAFRIDSIMIPSFLSMVDNGTFSIGVTLASALAIPATAVFTLYAPIISKLIKEEKFTELNLKYKQTASLLFFIGMVLFSCICIGIFDLFSLLPTATNLMASAPIILILGLNVLINMGTGFSSEIITYSQYYKFNLIAILILITLNISLNIVFLHFLHLGLFSVAIASLISMVTFNVAKMGFIYKKFGLFPFDIHFLKLVTTTLTIGIVVYFLPSLHVVLFTLLYKISLCLLLNLIIVYKLNVVEQYSVWVKNLIKKTSPLKKM